MTETPQFKLWLAIETGRIAAVAAEVNRLQIPDEDIKVEVRKAGQWVTVPSSQLQ